MEQAPMPMNRRLFLNRIGITTVAAAAVALPPAACTVMEDGELVEFGRQMDDAEIRYLAADDAWHAARARAVAMMPAVPAAVLVKAEERPMHPGMSLECLRDIDGKPMFYGPASDMKLSRQTLMQRVAAFDDLPDDHWAKNNEPHDRARKLLALDEGYDAACDGAREDSGYNAADDARRNAVRDILEVAARVVAMEPRTARGLLIQAKAVTAAAGLDHGGAFVMGKQFALNAERILGQVAQS
jgi:hypothetical protein